MDFCIFCAILEGDAPASFVAKRGDVAAFMDIMPVNPGHLLVVPVEHHTHLGDVPPAIVAAMMTLAQEAAAALRQSSVPTDGINLFLADGEAAGQEVFHSHLHVIPRLTQDGFVINPNYGPAPDRDSLDSLAEELRMVL